MGVNSDGTQAVACGTWHAPHPGCSGVRTDGPLVEMIDHLEVHVFRIPRQEVRPEKKEEKKKSANFNCAKVNRAQHRIVTQAPISIRCARPSVGHITRRVYGWCWSWEMRAKWSKPMSKSLYGSSAAWTMNSFRCRRSLLLSAVPRRPALCGAARGAGEGKAADKFKSGGGAGGAGGSVTGGA